MTKTPKGSAKAQSTREKILTAARRLFNSKGFAVTTALEVAVEAGVSNGLIFRYFGSKDELFLACIEQNVQENIAQRDAVTDAVKRGEISVFDALKSIALSRLTDPEIGIFYEMLAESFRGRPVKKRVRILGEMYREGIRYLVTLAKPGTLPDEIETYVDLIISSFLGLCYRPAVGAVENPEKISHDIACLLMKALDLPQSDMILKSAPRPALKRRRG